MLQQDYMQRLGGENDGKNKRALVETYGCQQNEADSDRIRGMLAGMGYLPTDCRSDADVIIFNTCAVREHAELKVFGNVGALKALKAKKPNLIIGLCGCMMQQSHRAEEVLRKHTQVDFVLGTHCLSQLPQTIYEVSVEKKRVVRTEERSDDIDERLPVLRLDKVTANVTIMYGCDNFCSYCVVPYVRGRERSRRKEEIIEEVRLLAKEGYRHIELLGQNVNSYGRGLYESYRFPDLLAELDAIEGQFNLSFMTSHPKDASRRLIDVMAKSRHIGHKLHLPVQSGSDRILALMNRRYTVEDYKKLASYARGRMPDLALTSDMIVGFPTESDEDFEQTIAFVKEMRFDGLFTFIYSARKGTPAAVMKGQIDKKTKSERLTRLIEAQAAAAKRKNEEFVGKTVRVLVESVSATDPGVLAARTGGGKLVHFAGSADRIGSYAEIRIERASPYALYGAAAN